MGSGDQGGTLPALDLARHTKVADLVRTLVADGVPCGVHDVSTGGLGGALLELAVRSGVGVSVSGVPSTAHLFSEAPSRVVACVPTESVGSVLYRAGAVGVAVVELGRAGGDRLTISAADGSPLVDLDLDETISAWRDRLPHALGEGVTQG